MCVSRTVTVRYIIGGLKLLKITGHVNLVNLVLIIIRCLILIQPDQINMAVFFWYLLKRVLSSVRYCTHVTGQVTFYKVKYTAMFN